MHGAWLDGRCPLTFAAAAVRGAAPWLRAQAKRRPGQRGRHLHLHRRQGARLTSDRPIAECVDREQRVLNADGSLRAILPPTLTADERAEQEARDAQARRSAAARKRCGAPRPQPAGALSQRGGPPQGARGGARTRCAWPSRPREQRLRDLAAERKPLLDEAEFYEGKPLPPQAQAAARRQRRGRRGAARVGAEPAGRAGAHQPPVRRRARPPEAAVGRRAAGLAGAAGPQRIAAPGPSSASNLKPTTLP